MHHPIKIAYVSDSVFPFHSGGKETRIFHLTRALARDGYDVRVYTMKWWQGSKDYSADGVTYHAISRLYPLYAGERRSLRQAVLFGLACFKLARYDFDILEVDHMPGFPLYAAKFVSFIRRRPLYATWHEVWGKAYWQQYLGTIKGRVAWWLEHGSALLPDHIIAVSPMTEQRLRKVLGYRGPVAVIANGIDQNHIDSVQAKTRSSDIIYVGHLNAHKNVAMLVRAISLLRTNYPNILCLIVGDGPESNRLSELVSQYGIEQNVLLRGRIDSNDEVYALMKSSKIFVLPSKREGFGVVVLEALACGLQVVTIEHEDNAARHLVPADGGLVCPPTAEHVAQAVETLLRKATDTRPNTRVAIGKYDWNRLAKQVEEVYAI